MRPVRLGGRFLLKFPQRPSDGLSDELRATSGASRSDTLELLSHVVFKFNQQLLHILHYIEPGTMRARAVNQERINDPALSA